MDGKRIVAMRVSNRVADKFNAVIRMARNNGVMAGTAQDILLDWIASQPQGKLLEVLKAGLLKQAGK